MKKDVKLTKEQMQMTREELVKDVKFQVAKKLLEELDDNIQLEWAKGDDITTLKRRIVQVEG